MSWAEIQPELCSPSLFSPDLTVHVSRVQNEIWLQLQTFYLFLLLLFFFFFMSSALHPPNISHLTHFLFKGYVNFPNVCWRLYFLGTLLWSCLSCCSVTRKPRAPNHSPPSGLSVVSNRNKTPPTCTSLTCRRQWTSRSWRTCWSPSVRPFPHASSVTPMEPVEEWALPGTRCCRTAGWSWLVVL